MQTECCHLLLPQLLIIPLPKSSIAYTGRPIDKLACGCPQAS